MRANKLKELPQQLIQMKGWSWEMGAGARCKGSWGQKTELAGRQDKQFACGHKTKRENEFQFGAEWVGNREKRIRGVLTLAWAPFC